MNAVITTTSRFVLTCSTLALLFTDTSCTETNAVRTRSGPIVGHQLSSPNGTVVSAFLGIPYAQPPIGRLRFAPPQEATPWTSVFNASRITPSCIQQLTEDVLQTVNDTTFGSGSSSEDCLTLNVFAPYPKPQNAPVVVYIHGGGFLAGSSLWWVDHTILASHGVITVAVNYRLGVFGFFSLGNEEAPGNVGLLDQVLAMKWVQENIEAFGGDKASVTLWGASAGSAAVGYHLLSSESRGLFGKVIMISGTPANTWAFRERDMIIKKSEKLLKKMNCSEIAPTDLDCLKEKTPEEILQATLQPNVMLSEHFCPTIDGRFLNERPDTSMSSGRFNEASVLIGNSVDDGAIILKTSNLDVITTTQGGRIKRKDFLKVVKNSWIDITDREARVIDVLYTNWSDPDDPLKLRDAAKDIYNDGIFICGINSFSDALVASGNDVYRYVFDHKTAAAAASAPDLEWIKATHASEQIILIGDGETRFVETEEDKAVRNATMKDFLNFIRTGNPNYPHPESTQWPRYSVRRYFKRFSISPSIETNYRVQECARWNEVLPLLEGNSVC